MKIGVLKRAIEEAEKSDYYPYKISSVIFKGSRIISYGHNSVRTCSGIHPKYKQWPNSLHAEQSSIIGVDWTKLKNSSILVIRLNRSGKMSLAYPCKMCCELILFVGIKWIYYSTRSGEIKRERVKNYEH